VLDECWTARTHALCEQGWGGDGQLFVGQKALSRRVERHRGERELKERERSRRDVWGQRNLTGGWGGE